MSSHHNRYFFFCFLFALLLASPATSQVTQDCTGNESWTHAGISFGGTALATTEMDGKLYVLHQNDPIDSLSFQISVWDGSVWSVETSFRFAAFDQGRNFAKIMAFQGYKGDIYMSGNFYMESSSLGSFVRWDGTSWSSVLSMNGAPKFMKAAACCIHNGNLIISATFYESQNKVGTGMVQFDGTTWSYLLSQGEHLFPVSTILSWNGDLYAGVGGAIARRDNDTWTDLGPGSTPQLFGFITDIFVYNNQLYAAGAWDNGNEKRSNIFRWDGTTWTRDIPQPDRVVNNMRVVVHDNQAFMISVYDSSYTLADNGSFQSVDRFDGTAWHKVSNFNGRVHFLASYQGNLLAGGNFTSSCGIPLGGIGMLCDEQNCGRVSGKIFQDTDDNCIQDEGDKGLAQRMVTLTPGPYHVITDKDGNYSRFVPNGSYTVASEPRTHWSVTCPASPGTHQVNVSGASSASNIDFSMRPAPGVQDLRVSMIAGRVRAGRPFMYIITYENVGTVSMNGTVRLALDPILIFDAATATPSRQNSNVIEWDFTNLEVDETRTFIVYVRTPITTPAGTNVCSQLDIPPVVVAPNDNNRDSVCVPVTGSYDPNDIQVTPYGVDNNGVITSEDHTLTYWVRFQNTGNDTAFKVVVTDKLSPNVDISSIRLGAASHPFTFSIDKDNMLRWTFDNILLPDSNASEINSHGFFKFSVDLKPGLATGTEIANFVDIFFDYNAPVRTNTVVSIIGAVLGVDYIASTSTLSIYPNPARGVLHLNGELRNGAVVKLRNLLGQELATYHHDGTGMMTIDATMLPAGIYLLEAETPDGVMMERISVVR